MKRIAKLGGILCMVIALSGCAVVIKTENGRENRSYELMDIRDVPQELRTKIEEKWAQPFELTYSDMEYLYMVKGYGKKEESGFCIEIAECTESQDAICIEVILHGPGGKGVVCDTEYPFCVLKTAYTEKQVIFEE